jgi:flagellar biosynthesis/type III secretory pathway ATPase
MGAYAPGNDSLLDDAVVAQPQLIEFLKQPACQNFDLGVSREMLVGAFGE